MAGFGAHLSPYLKTLILDENGNILGGPLNPIRIDPTGTTVQPVSGGGGGGSNAAAGLTGAAVPTSADYQGVNIGGNLTGVTGFSLTNSKAAAIAIVDGSGNQITSFGGGIQFADNSASGATPTGTLSMGWDSANSKVRALKVDASQNLQVLLANTSIAVTGTFFQATQPVSIAATVNVSVQNATLAVTQSTSPWVENVSQFGGNAVVTGTGASGVGIPRVTVSNDSVISSITNTVTVSGTVVANAGSGTFNSDVTDRAGRLLGVIYGSQGQQVKQTATNFNLQVELATGGALYDARQIRALTSSDVVTVSQATAANLNATIVFASPQHVIVDSGSITANAGTNLNTSALQLDATGQAPLVAGGGTVAPSKVQMVGGKTNDGTPQYDILPLGAGGRSVIIEGFAGGTAVPISGTVSVTNFANPLPVSQSGTWTVQPGNTANTTPWLTSISQGGHTATVAQLTNSNPLAVELVDQNGNQIISFGGGSQYAEGTVNAAPTGTVAMGIDPSGTLHGLSLDVSKNQNIAISGATPGVTNGVVVNGVAAVLDMSDGPVAPGYLASQSSLIGARIAGTSQQASLWQDVSGNLLVNPPAQNTISDTLQSMLAQLKLLNINLASSMSSAYSDADTLLMDTFQTIA